ncbi:MAG: hypothetical protein V5A43_04865 [Haloarculaceae archaeon]
MEGTKQETSQRDTEPSDPVNYMPGMPTLSDRPDVLERVVTTLFRRRGTPPAVRIRQN